MIFFIELIIFFFSVIIHEISHGYAALRKGDTTARDMGRLTFNPIPHIDLFGTIILPLIFLLMPGGIIIGWAKPVPINPYYFKDMKKDLIVVSAVGPLSNIGLAIILAVLFRMFPYGILGNFMRYGVAINLLLAFFNLIPIPPLDGSQILQGFLPYEMREKYLNIGRFGFLIIIVLLWLGLLNYILLPLVYNVFRLLTGSSF